MYIHARGPQALLIAGTNSPTDVLIRAAGAKNAVQDFDGMERLTLEDIHYLNPDFLLMSKKSIESLEGKIYNVPEIIGFTAYRLGRLIIMEENELLNLGLNTGKAALQLSKNLYEKQTYTPLPAIPLTGENETPAIVEKKNQSEVEIIKKEEN